MPTITNAPALVDGKSLLPADLFTRLEARIKVEHPALAPDTPARILDQALAFLGTCAVATEPIGPSELVDIGWHTFMLYTHQYADFCNRIAGRFIHHVPDDRPTGDEMPTVPSTGQVTLADTVTAIRAAGFRIDPALWSMTSAVDCTQCHAGCHDSPSR